MPIEREELLATLKKLKKCILATEERSISEQDTRQGLINPLFRSLGWDFSDFTVVKSEFRLKEYNEPVDYAIFRDRDSPTPLLLVEAKALGSDLKNVKIIKQICSYMGTMGVQWGLLTDGNIYVMYNSNAGISFEEQKFLTLQIKTADTDDGIPSEELADKFIALLSRDSLVSNGIQRFYQTHAVNRHIETALESLLTEPFDTLALAIKKEFKEERVNTNPNLRISKQQIIDYLDRLKDEEGRIPFTVGDDMQASSNEALQAVAQSQLEGTEVREVEARRTRRVTIADLLAEGLIAAGDNWRANHKGEIFWGRITSSGEIDVNGTTFASPSKATSAVTNWASNAWNLWHYKDEQGEWRSVDILRKQYRQRHGLVEIRRKRAS